MGSYQMLVENSRSQGGITGLNTGFDELNRRIDEEGIPQKPYARILIRKKQ